MEQKTTETAQTKRITLGTVLGWIFGVLFIMSGAGALTTTIVGGMLVLLGGLLILPPVNTLMKDKLNFELSGGLRTILALILVFVGVGMGAGDDLKQLREGNDVAAETEEAENATYQEVMTFGGTGTKKSEPFTIQGDRFKVSYDCKGEPNMTLCQASVYKVGSKLPTSFIMNTMTPIKDETIVYGSGEYYIDANTVGNFSMTVYDYR